METYDILDSELGYEQNGNDGIPIHLTPSNKFILFYIFTFGLYGIWWMYKTWAFFKVKENSKIWPVARAIFVVFFIYELFEKIKRFAKSNNHEVGYASEGLFGGYVVLFLASKLPDPYWLISVLSFLCFLQPINAFNQAISNSDLYDANINSGFSGRQIALLIFGAIWWLLNIIVLTMGDDISNY